MCSHGTAVCPNIAQMYGMGQITNLYEVHGAGESMCHHFGETGPAQGHVIHAKQVHPLPSLCSPNCIESVPCAPCPSAQHPLQKLVAHCSCCHRVKHRAAQDDAHFNLVRNHHNHDRQRHDNSCESAVIVMSSNQAEVCRIAMGRQSNWASVFVELTSYAVEVQRHQLVQCLIATAAMNQVL